MISFINGKILGVKDTDSSAKWRQSRPHPEGVWDPRGTRHPRAALPSCPASEASAVREHAQVCSSLPHRHPAPPCRTQVSMSPPVKRKQVLVSSRLQLIQVQTALRLAECKGRSWGLGDPQRRPPFHGPPAPATISAP